MDRMDSDGIKMFLKFYKTPPAHHGMVDLSLGNPRSSVAVTTLLTDRHRLIPKLDPNSYNCIGNLYSSHGINYLLQTLLKNPHLTTLVLFGHCMTKSDEDLLRLWREGVQEGKISGTKVSVLLKPEHVDLVRHNEQIVDLRKCALVELTAKLEALSKQERKPYGEPIDAVFAEEEKRSEERRVGGECRS